MYTIQDKLSADVKDYAHHKEMMAEMGETTDCKKLILADGSHICVKDMTKQPSKAQ